MAVPCVTDTCSVTGSIGADRRLSLAVRLDPTGGLVCGTDDDENAGLRVGIYEDPGTSGALNDACLNGLRRTAAGELLAVSPRAGLKTISGTQQIVPHNASQSSNSLTADNVATNPFDCQVLGVIYGRTELTYSVGAGDEYNADMRSRIIRNGTADVAVFSDIGGSSVDANIKNSVKRRYDYFFDTFTAFAGAAFTFTADANHETAAERVNVDTESNGLGFRALVNVMFLPFNAAATP